MKNIGRLLYGFVGRKLNIKNVEKYGTQATMDKEWIITAEKDKMGTIVTFMKNVGKRMWIYRVAGDSLEIVAYMDEKETLIYKCHFGEILLLNENTYDRLMKKQDEMVDMLRMDFKEDFEEVEA